ncbi:uncharacterized protein ASPGLDRAFT_46621 [Aspergillus glaucus CBS 516.65]|uniref:Uncharacterized protein n=1 Tax=Aspergillus glaucus CBS 516.65 TaxID=1160497 RepID=A0A1L9VLG5_ASPGL|nr:hypothetical protein ASPGLDRAFT_46621 [Aspergillus glaucus CBS 516.65]OJJ84722.1 hypothetical protein ASPGLDRAFT_46621 [Aspergillus glaucus CBS 516.65]
MLSGWPRGVWLLFGTCPWIVGSIYPLTSQFLSPSFSVSIDELENLKDLEDDDSTEEAGETEG